jgi:hypothetical protein
MRLSDTRRKELDETRPVDKKYYRASSAGMCARKLYYETVLRLEPSEEIKPNTRRVFRLGDLIHQDIQDSLLDAASQKKKKQKENI